MTTERIIFDQFAQVFPTTDMQVPIITDSEIRYVSERDPVFIPPRWRVARQVRAGTALVLVEARAALGKSMVARNLAHATHGLYWDMSEIHVGHGTLWGRLAQTFGPDGLGS